MPTGKASKGYTILKIRLTPRSDRNAIERYEEGQLYARVTASPVKGEANRALLLLLAEALEVPKSHMELIAGTTAREKVVRIEGIEAAELYEKLQRCLKSETD
ncbi:hypothetical protein CWRG_00359 [Chthonomonas calidirosea]|uniref:DUF167 domain-containing protein n=1 Tax=Chthonomonas calidirosea TaxID=454171 RepID=UPI0006DD3AF5|nr:DUF167 family protein [Chthonomonas calidirosea]CEK13100.1 hypothetical protein CWRG_00359 [Chthonomonas calidirosea]